MELAGDALSWPRTGTRPSMLNKPLVSVVIPVFNGRSYLRETVASVCSQTYGNIELILVDGGSDDDTLELLSSLEQTVSRIEYLGRDTPVTDTWTESCALASGSYLKLLCQDDILYPDALADQVQFLMNFPSLGMVFSKRNIIDASGRVVGRAHGGISGSSRELSEAQALRFGYLAGSNVYGEPLAVMFRRDVLHACLPWDSSLPYLIDMSMYSKVMQEGPVGYLDRVVGAFRISSESWSVRLSSDQKNQFRDWQRQVESRVGRISSLDRFRAFVNVYRVANARSLVYSWLRLRGKMRKR